MRQSLAVVVTVVVGGDYIVIALVPKDQQFSFMVLYRKGESSGTVSYLTKYC